MRPDTLRPDMDDELNDWYGLDTLAELVKAVDVARLAPEMRKTAAAVVEHLPFAARQLAAVLSQPGGQAATGSSHTTSKLSHCLQVRANTFCSPVMSKDDCKAIFPPSYQSQLKLVSLHSTDLAHSLMQGNA